MGEIISSADVQTISTQNAALRAEVERLRNERDGAFTRYDALLWQIANEGCVSARVGEGTRECGFPVCGLCRLVNDRDFYRENSAALGHALEIGNAKIEDLRAEVERLRERLERIDAFAGERCEASGCRPDPCGPVEYHDVEGVPLCAECWQECLDEAAEEEGRDA